MIALDPTANGRVSCAKILRLLKVLPMSKSSTQIEMHGAAKCSHKMSESKINPQLSTQPGSGNLLSARKSVPFKGHSLKKRINEARIMAMEQRRRQKISLKNKRRVSN